MKKVLFIIFLQVAFVLLVYISLAFGNATFDLREMNTEFRGMGGFLIIVGCVFIPVMVNLTEDFKN